MARSHSHNVKIGEARKARRRRRKTGQFSRPQRLAMNVEFALAWICNDASCTAAHGGVA